MTPELAIILVLLIFAAAWTPAGFLIAGVASVVVISAAILIAICIVGMGYALVSGIRGFIRWATE